MQMHKGPPCTPVSMLRTILANEGPAVLMRGWQASVMREMSYSSIRMGLYDEVKAVLQGRARLKQGVHAS